MSTDVARDNGDWIEEAHRALAAGGHRTGGARTVVVELLGRVGGGVTAQELATLAQQGPRPASLASVYRTLGILVDLGRLHPVDVGNGIARYELVLPDGQHRHHVVCRRCARTDVFEDEPLEEAIHAVERRTPFRVETHDVVLRGLCPDCAQDDGD